MSIENNPKHSCCGCEACVLKCPKGAISMHEDDEGFVYPTVDKEACVECGVCEKVCQYISPVQKHDTPLLAYGGHNVDAEVLDQSTSGGAFSTIVDFWCDDNYVIFGAESKGLKVFHSFITDKALLKKFRRSKYSQSRMGTAYRDAKAFLKEGKKVLFSGTPCQIAGLKSYFGGKDYSNLLTVEVICEGVPSPLFVRKLEDKIKAEHGSIIETLDYRFKDGNKWDYEVMKISFFQQDSGKIKSKKKDRWFNPFWSIWLQHLMSRPSCYKCLYTTPDRVADITLGDLWGVHLYCPDLYNSNRGCSLVVVNTSLGKSVLEGTTASGMFVGRELEFSQALRYQGPMRKSISEHPKRRDFITDLQSPMSYDAICRKWAKRPSLKLLISKYVWGTNRQKVWIWKIKRMFKKV